MINILDYTYEEIESLMVSIGEQKFRAKQLYLGLYEGKTFDEITNISKGLKEKLKQEYIDILMEKILIKDKDSIRESIKEMDLKTIDQFVIINAVLSIAFYFTYSYFNHC